MGVYCRRWGVPLIDGGTVRLPRLVGEGRAMDLVLTGRRVDADEALAIGLCEYVVPEGEAREKAEALARDIARFPQSCMRADRRSVRTQHGLSERDALRQEWRGSKAEVTGGIEGAARFAGGKGRGGDFSDVTGSPSARRAWLAMRSAGGCLRAAGRFARMEGSATRPRGN